MKVKSSKKISTIGVFATSLFVTTIAAYIFSPVFKSSAESVNVGTQVNSVISLSTDNNNLLLSGNPGQFVSGNVSAAISTNSAFGYTLGMEDSDSLTNLISATSEDAFTSTFTGTKTGDTFENNTWGYSIDGTNYYKIPSLNSPVRIKATTGPTGSDTATLYFGIKIGGNITSGYYSGQIMLTAYVNGVDGDPEDGTALLDPNDAPEPYEEGEGVNENKLVLLTSMQDPNVHQYCSDTYTPTSNAKTVTFTRYFSGDIAPRAVVKDKRDGTKYLITKQADGNCWMTSNLALDLSTEVTLTSKLTDLNTKTSYTPNKSTFMGSVMPETWRDTDTAQRSLHPSDSMAYYQGGKTVSSTPTEDTNAYLWERAGNYYTWYAATAGSGRMEYMNASDSICPKGWMLPLGWTSHPSPDKSYADLFYDAQVFVDQTASTPSNMRMHEFYEDPMNFVASGLYYYGDVNIRENGWHDIYLTSWSTSNYRAYVFDLYDGSSSPSAYTQNGRDKAGLSSVRCVAR